MRWGGGCCAGSPTGQWLERGCSGCKEWETGQGEAAGQIPRDQIAGVRGLLLFLCWGMISSCISERCSGWGELSQCKDLTERNHKGVTLLQGHSGLFLQFLHPQNNKGISPDGSGGSKQVGDEEAGAEG